MLPLQGRGREFNPLTIHQIKYFMDLKIQPLFPSFVAMDQLENDLDNDAIVDFCYQQYANCPRPKYEGGWQSHHLDLEFLDSSPMDSLLKLMNVNIVKVRDLVGVDPTVKHEIANYWINIKHPGLDNHHHLDSNAPHFHPNYFLSCVYYPKVSDNCGDLYFMSPFPGAKYALPFPLLSKQSIYNDVEWSVKPETGKLVIFPSWLTHWVNPNHSQEDRISIAFNIALPRVHV